MPRSPVISSWAPSSTSSPATAAPRARDRSASSRVRASSRWIAPEPRRTLRAVTSAGRSDRSASTATSRTVTATPCSRASAETPARPGDDRADHGFGDGGGVRRDAVRRDAVVAGEHHEAYVGQRRGGTSPCAAASQAPSSPIRPRAPGGVARPASRSLREGGDLGGGRGDAGCLVHGGASLAGLPRARPLRPPAAGPGAGGVGTRPDGPLRRGVRVERPAVRARAHHCAGALRPGARRGGAGLVADRRRDRLRIAVRLERLAQFPNGIIHLVPEPADGSAGSRQAGRRLPRLAAVRR